MILSQTAVTFDKCKPKNFPPLPKVPNIEASGEPLVGTIIQYQEIATYASLSTSKAKWNEKWAFRLLPFHTTYQAETSCFIPLPFERAMSWKRSQSFPIGFPRLCPKSSYESCEQHPLQLLNFPTTFIQYLPCNPYKSQDPVTKKNFITNQKVANPNLPIFFDAILVSWFMKCDILPFLTPS